jgi:DNA-binding transcriptional LysR family regulator
MLAVREHKSFSKTADVLGMSVSNVSRMAKRFENNVGRTLFIGDLRRSTMSEEGKLFLDILEPIFDGIAQFKVRAEGVADKAAPA